MYENAMKIAGYNQKLNHIEDNQSRNKKTRKRNILWFNPPWNDAVSTNVGGKFLHLIDKHFPKDSPFHKYVNRKNVKVSYSCMPNMKTVIAGHNKAKLRPEQEPEKKCNCRSECVLGGSCLTQSVVYKCTVSTENDAKDYIGLTSNSFKERYTAHKSSFKDQSKSNQTALSSHIWDLTKMKKPHTVTWSILKKAPAYSKESQICQLCLTEKTLISLADNNNTLNKRNEIIAKCRHRDKFLLKNW